MIINDATKAAALCVFENDIVRGGIVNYHRTIDNKDTGVVRLQKRRVIKTLFVFIYLPVTEKCDATLISCGVPDIYVFFRERQKLLFNYLGFAILHTAGIKECFTALNFLLLFPIRILAGLLGNLSPKIKIYSFILKKYETEEGVSFWYNGKQAGIEDRYY